MAVPSPRIALRDQAARRKIRNIGQVFEHRETGADGESRDRGVHHEAHAVRSQQPGDIQRLCDLFDYRRARSRPDRRRDDPRRIDRCVQAVANHRDCASHAHRSQHAAQRQQFVGVDQLQREKKNQHRKRARSNLGENQPEGGWEHQRIRSETMYSVVTWPLRSAAAA